MYNKLNESHTPKKWFTSDFHFGHYNIIKYCDRPWNTVEEMDNALIKIWNDTVRPEDTVYFIGDFSMSPITMEKISSKLVGHKILIAGNHDRCWKEKIKELTRYKTSGWEVHKQLELKLKDGTTVLLCHLPYHDESIGKYDSRYLQQRPKDKGMFLLHGHLHCKYLKSKRKIDVGIDNTFALYSENFIIDLIEKNEDFIPSRLTQNEKV